MVQPLQSFQVDSLPVRVYPSQEAMSEAVASDVRDCLSGVIARQGGARVILATGNSQVQFLSRLAQLGGVDWSCVTLFHMDEYLGIDANHPASFRRYLRERVQSMVKPRVFHYLAGDCDLPLDEIERYTRLLREAPVDLCCLGIGENGHIAFNDPPVARFEETHVVKLVKLDEACKLQQVNEGHFASLESVPQYAFTLTIPALCSARRMMCIAPEARKAPAVRDALHGPIATSCPASFLRRQSHCTLFLDSDSASLLGEKTG
jgi:glucosamine-6-phosphate deaminase